MSPSNLSAGTVLADKLRVVKLLGEGGMGSVYEVEHLRTRKRCALKLLHPRASRSGRILSRFWREASMDGRIADPHIVGVHDAGVLPSGEPYLLMELLSGETLAERIAREAPLALEEICEIVRQVCEGVQAAHEARVIHRDLKPQNLFLTTREGRLFVKVLDFGVSKLVDDGATMTTPGTAIGTPAYMAPEQLSGEDAVDERSDIYSLGVLLYECATGRRPFSAARVEQLAMLVREGRPAPLRAWRRDLPERFCDLVARAMAVEKARRFASARDLGRALGEVLGSRGDVSADETLVDGEARRSIEGSDLLNSTVHIEPPGPRAPLRSRVEQTSISGVAPVAPPSPSPGKRVTTKRRLAITALLGLASVAALHGARPEPSAGEGTEDTRPASPALSLPRPLPSPPSESPPNPAPPPAETTTTAPPPPAGTGEPARPPPAGTAKPAPLPRKGKPTGPRLPSSAPQPGACEPGNVEDCPTPTPVRRRVNP